MRRDALSRRDGLSLAFRREASDRLLSFLDQLPIPPSSSVAGFMAIRSEIDPLPLMHVLLKRGHELSLPVVLADRETTIFRAWDGVSSLEKSGFGLSVPASNAPQVDPQVLLIPLAAFDRRGYRIGYGKGHYDRAIARLEAKQPIVKIGLAFATQEIADVPSEPHDRRLDFVLTENGLLTIGF